MLLVTGSKCWPFISFSWLCSQVAMSISSLLWDWVCCSWCPICPLDFPVEQTPEFSSSNGLGLIYDSDDIGPLVLGSAGFRTRFRHVQTSQAPDMNTICCRYDMIGSSKISFGVPASWHTVTQAFVLPRQGEAHEKLGRWSRRLCTQHRGLPEQLPFLHPVAWWSNGQDGSLWKDRRHQEMPAEDLHIVCFSESTPFGPRWIAAEF